MGTRTPARPGALLVALALVGLPGPADAAPRVIRELPYAGADGGHARSLDLYLPAATGQAPPLLAFVQSRFWSRSDWDRLIAIAVARPLQRDGAAVAVIRHRPAPDYRHPAQVEDVAAAVAFLVENADRYGYDPGRIHLAGHGSGAHLAALLALDPAPLEARGVPASALAGVIAISGIYDLDPEGLSDEEKDLYEAAFDGGRKRRAASPLRLVHADAPPFLVLAAEDDVPGYRDAALDFAQALRDAGNRHVDAWIAPGRDHRTVLDMAEPRNAARMYVVAQLGLEPLPPEVEEAAAAMRYWRHPALSTEPFWSREKLVRSHPVDARFLASARRIFVGSESKGREWQPKRFHAIDLMEFLEESGPDVVGRGPFLVLSNVRGERLVWRVDDVRRYRPVIVVGIDDERNLFRVIDLYQRRREYSWRDDAPEPPFLARPLGAFVYFLEEPPPELQPPGFAHYSLTPESIRLAESDPLAPLRDVPPDVLEVLTWRNGCLYCHQLRGVGARAGHLRARDGAVHGGFALPLEEYPPGVWRRFVFEQQDVAEELGARPNSVDAAAAERLFELVERERAAATGSPRAPAVAPSR